MTLARFTEMWASSANYPPEPVSPADLRSVEQRLNFRLPSDYRQAVLEFGLPHLTIALLDAIVERKLELNSLSDFYSPTEIIKETIAWREIGMPEQLVAFASDECGNKFCFDAERLRNGCPEGPAVWFYDHDFETVDLISSSFDNWIEAYCRVQPWREMDAS